jgi:peptide chain release factor
MIRSLLGRHIAARASCLPSAIRPFTASSPLQEKPLPPRPKILETEIEESFLKGTGPGGQKINKTSSAVQLKHIPTGIVVKSQETRSRQQNRKLARLLLAEKLDILEKGDQSRTAIKAEKARAKKASAEKKKRRKYRRLAEEADEKQDGEQDVEAGEEGHEEVKDGTHAQDGPVK